MLEWITCWIGLVMPTPQQTVFVGSWTAGEDTLTGLVVGTDGQPIEGATVELRTRVPRESALRARGSTDSTGRFTLHVGPLPDDHVMRMSFLEIEAAGWARSQLERVYLPPPSLDVGPIELHPPVELHGRVSGTDGSPIAGAAIHGALGLVRAPYGDHARRAPVAVSDENGEYSCRVLPPGLVTLGAEAPGFADCVLEPFALRAGESNSVDFVLEPERPIRLDVRSSDRGSLADAEAVPLGDVAWHGPWSDQSRFLAFWCDAEHASPEGTITLRGLAPSFRGAVLVTAPDHRPELVELTRERLEVELEPVIWIEVTTVRRDGGPPPEIYQVVVRDTTRAQSWCGNCDDSRLAKLWADSPAVRRLAPDRWLIAWNSPDCYVDGGMPGSVSVSSNYDGHGWAELPAELAAGSKMPCTAEFDPPARLAGVVLDPAGRPVSLRLGIQLSFYRSDWLAVVSGEDGRFTFDRVGEGPQWLYSLDDRWSVDDDCDRVELVAGQSTEGVTVIVHPHPDGRTGKVSGTLRIDGKPPGEPVLLALDEVPNQHLPDAYPRGFAWTDAEGHFEIGSFWPRDYHILPKRRPPEPSGGWRDFAAEFPVHDESWRWIVTVPESGTTHDEIDLPAASLWDHPPRSP